MGRGRLRRCDKRTAGGEADASVIEGTLITEATRMGEAAIEDVRLTASGEDALRMILIRP